MPSEFFNPADHLLDLVSVDPRSSQYDHSLTRVHGLTDKWKARQHIKESGEEGAGIASDTAVIKRGEGTTSMKVAFPVVLERTWKNLWRKKDVSDTSDSAVQLLLALRPPTQAPLSCAAYHHLMASSVLGVPPRSHRTVPFSFSACLPRSSVLTIQAFFNRLLQPPLLGGLFILFFQRLSRGPSGKSYDVKVEAGC
jgi:hypothetical protein